MICFVECSIPRTKYLRDEFIENHPVNLALCRQLRRKQRCWYPDNDGLPAIDFVGCEAEWVFATEAERESELARLIAMGEPK